LEEFMVIADYEFQSDFYRRRIKAAEAEGQARGEARGEAKAVLAILDARGIEVPDDLRDEVVNCTDLDRLDTWLRRAATADTIEDLGDLATR
jgi:hypothetical protein